MNTLIGSGGVNTLSASLPSVTQKQMLSANKQPSLPRRPDLGSCLSQPAHKTTQPG